MGEEEDYKAHNTTQQVQLAPPAVLSAYVRYSRQVLTDGIGAGFSSSSLRLSNALPRHFAPVTRPVWKSIINYCLWKEEGEEEKNGEGHGWGRGV